MSEPTANFDFDSGARKSYPNRYIQASNETTPVAVCQSQLAISGGTDYEGRGLPNSDKLS